MIICFALDSFLTDSIVIDIIYWSVNNFTRNLTGYMIKNHKVLSKQDNCFVQAKLFNYCNLCSTDLSMQSILLIIFKRFATASTSTQAAVLPWRYDAEMGTVNSLHASA